MGDRWHGGEETSMYGTLMRANVTPGNRETVVALMGEGAGAKGFQATHVLWPDDDDRTVIAAILFEDDATYSANAHDPATEEWYGRFRALLEADPEWTDGEWVSFLPTR
jgi:hypothetical protein